MTRQKKEIPKALFNSSYFKQTDEFLIVYTENLKLKGYDHRWYGERAEQDRQKGVRKLVANYYRVKIGSPEQIALFEELQITEHDEEKEKRTRKKQAE